MPAPIPLEAVARAVRAAFGDAVGVLKAEPLAGDASTRRYVRVRLDGGRAPATAVVMLLGPDRAPLGSDELGDAVTGDEIPFVNVARYLARHGLAVPAVYHDAAHSDG